MKEEMNKLKSTGYLGNPNITEMRDKINEIIEYIKQPEAHEHNYVPKQYVGTWSASVPPPTMICTKCGSWI